MFTTNYGKSICQGCVHKKWKLGAQRQSDTNIYNNLYETLRCLGFG